VSLLESEALVVRTVEVGESDLVATFVTRQVGKISAIARGARKSSRRMGGALEPIHTVSVRLDDKGGAHLATLKEARVVRARAGVTASLEALEAAGVALRWARHVFPVHTPEPQGWDVLVHLLDELDAGGVSPRKELARTGLALLAAVGWGLDLERCVACGKAYPPGRPARVDARRGGLVCQSCGGAAGELSAAEMQAARALGAGNPQDISEAVARRLLDLVDSAMAAHTGFER
jgi:DNA repair protein RecO (recombination protein O)